MKILITGISGFVGSNLHKDLCSNHEIYGLDINVPKVSDYKVLYGWDELSSIPAMDIIIHLAGMAHDTKNQTEASRYFQVNTELTKIIYSYFLKSTAKKFIFFSSVKAVADVVVDDILTENVMPSPKGPYGESKLAAEQFITSNKPTNDLQKVFILRPCMIHGPGNKGNLNLLFKVVKSSIPWPLGAFENLRSFTSMDNLSFIVNQLIIRDVADGVYNIADDEPLSTNDLIALINSSLSKNTPVWNVNHRLIEVLSAIGTVLHLPLNKDRLRKLTENYIVSNEKIKRELGLTSLPFTASEGMIRTLRSFQ